MNGDGVLNEFDEILREFAPIQKRRGRPSRSKPSNPTTFDVGVQAYVEWARFAFRMPVPENPHGWEGAHSSAWLAGFSDGLSRHLELHRSAQRPGGRP